MAREGARESRIGTPVQTGCCGETGNGEGAEPSTTSLHGTCPNSNRRNFSILDTLELKPSTRRSPQLTQPSDEKITRSANTGYTWSVRKVSDLWAGKRNWLTWSVGHLITLKVVPLGLQTLLPAVPPLLEACRKSLFRNGV